MTQSPILTDTDGPIATIRLNRPDQHNSLDGEARSQLLTALRSASDDADIRAVIITGTGPVFCAGQDLREAHLAAPGTRVGDVVRDSYNPIVLAIATMPKPVIAAVNGMAAGAGVSIALICDIRVASRSARFTTAFAGIGLSCDNGISWTLPRVVGRAAAIELLMRPRVVDSAEALALGLVHQVIADDRFVGDSHAIAAELAAGPTLALASIKAAVNHASTATLDDALEFEATQMEATGASRDHRAAVSSFLTKTKPHFEGH